LNQPVEFLFHRLALLGRKNPLCPSVALSLLRARALEKISLGAAFLED
jgi:hypothetical protein